MRNFLILILIGLNTFAGAQEKPRLIDFNRTLVGLDGTALIDPTSKQPLTLGLVVSTALDQPQSDDAKQGYRENMVRGDLAQRVYRGGRLALTSDEISLIKKRLPFAYGALVVSQAVHMLDPAEK